MRLLSWNIENIAPWLDGGLPEHLARLGDWDVICLQEIRLRPADRDRIAALERLLPGYTCAYSLCDDPRNITFRGGRAYGVATFVRETIDSLSSSPKWDREGRVLVTALPAHHLAVVNLYAVNGTSKAYVDPDTGAPRGDRHARKQAFQDQLMDLASELVTAADVVLAGDWNVSQTRLDVTPRLRTEEPHATARAKLLARFAAGDWVDVFRARAPDARKYTWRARGRKLDAARVDYFVVNRALVPRVTAAEILEDRARSDHAPLTLEFT